MIEDPGARRGDEQAELALEGLEAGQGALQLAVHLVEQLGEARVGFLDRLHVDPDAAPVDRLYHRRAGLAGTVDVAPGRHVFAHGGDVEVLRVDRLDQGGQGLVGEEIIPLGEIVLQLDGAVTPELDITRRNGVEDAWHGGKLPYQTLAGLR